MARPPRDGDFYINNANQDFWMRENGAWVRKGNIRDEGTTGLVGIQPIISQGFSQNVAHLDRIRFLDATNASLGFGQATAVTRSRMLAAAMRIGFDKSVVMTDGLVTLAASMGLGYLQSVSATRERDLLDASAFGFNQTTALTHTTPSNLQLLAGSNVNFAPGSGTPVTFTYTNSSPCVMIACIYTLGGTGFVPVTSITDTAGQTWTRRSQNQFNSALGGQGGTLHGMSSEVWYTNLTTNHGSAVTVTVNLDVTNQAGNTRICRLGITGSSVPATPWDINAGVPALNTYSNTLHVTAQPTVNWTSSSVNPMVISFLHEFNEPGGSPMSSAGSGFTGTNSITIGTSGTGQVLAAIEEQLASGSSGTATWTTNQIAWTCAVDALTSDSNGEA